MIVLSACFDMDLVNDHFANRKSVFLKALFAQNLHLNTPQFSKLSFYKPLIFFTFKNLHLLENK
jgi:hypothetical protein